MQNNAKVSVIVPVYNVEKYLRKCLDSIINQTLKEIEIICVNDGSTDNSRAILEEYKNKDSRIIIVDKTNGGLSSARNTGIKVATAPYIGFVDSDDWIEPQTYEISSLYMQEDIDAVGFGANIVLEGIDEHSDRVVNEKAYHKLNMFGKYKICDTTIKMLSNTCWNKLYKRSIINKYEIDFPEGNIFEDGEFFHKYFLHVRNIYIIKEYFYNYILRQQSIMHDVYTYKRGVVLDSLKNYMHIYEHYKKFNELENHKDLLTCAFEGHLYYIYKKNNDEGKKEVLKYATEIASQLDEKIIQGKILSYLKERKYYKIKFLNIPLFVYGNKIFGIAFMNSYLKIYTPFIKFNINLKKIFALTNNPDGLHKDITILCLNFKLRRKNVCASKMD